MRTGLYSTKAVGVIRKNTDFLVIVLKFFVSIDILHYSLQASKQNLIFSKLRINLICNLLQNLFEGIFSSSM